MTSDRLTSGGGLGDDGEMLLQLIFDVLREPEHRDAGLEDSLLRLGDQDQNEVFSLLDAHFLAPLWYWTVKRAGGLDLLSVGLLKSLESAFSRSVGASLVRERALGAIRDALDGAGVEWVVLKGSHLARTIYDDPALRPAQDIDVLVREDARRVVCDALVGAGFVLQPPLSTATHEISLRGWGVAVDLHWRVLRPGRANVSLVDLALSSRERLTDKVGVWVPGEIAATVVQLIHPAVTEYVTGRLIRVIDLDRWVAAHPRALREALPIVDRAGLKTAGWAMLSWASHWTRQQARVRQELEMLAPSLLYRWYLAKWIRMNPAAVYQRHPLLARAGFSLMLNDTWFQRAAAAARLIKGLIKLKREGFEP